MDALHECSESASMADVSSWVTIVFTTLGAGVAGSLITTYGTQTKERRIARAKARESLRRCEQATKRAMYVPHELITAALDEFDTNAMLAGLPAGLVNLHREATIRYWALTKFPPRTTDDEPRLISPESVAAGRVSYQASKLLASATWHPWRILPYRLWRLRRLRKILEAAMPGRAKLDRQARENRRVWERDVLRKRKEEAPDDTAHGPDWDELRRAIREER